MEDLIIYHGHYANDDEEHSLTSSRPPTRDTIINVLSDQIISARNEGHPKSLVHRQRQPLMDENNGCYCYVTTVINNFAVNRDVIMPQD